MARIFFTKMFCLTHFNPKTGHRHCNELSSNDVALFSSISLVALLDC